MKLCRSAAFLAFLVIFSVHGPVRAGPPVSGDRAPDFQATTFDGDDVALSDLRGRVVILNFWATWCGPCKAEMPMLDVFYKKLKDQGLVILAVATEDSLNPRQLRPLSKALSFPLVKHMWGPYAAIGGAVPTSYVIDRAGVIRYAEAGKFTLDGLNELLIPLLNEPVPATDQAGKPL